MDPQLTMINLVIESSWQKPIVNLCYDLGLLQFRIVRWVLNIKIEDLAVKVAHYAKEKLLNISEYNQYKTAFSDLLKKDWSFYDEVAEKWIKIAFPPSNREIPVVVEEREEILLKERVRKRLDFSSPQVHSQFSGYPGSSVKKDNVILPPIDEKNQTLASSKSEITNAQKPFLFPPIRPELSQELSENLPLPSTTPQLINVANENRDTPPARPELTDEVGKNLPLSHDHPEYSLSLPPSLPEFPENLKRKESPPDSPYSKKIQQKASEGNRQNSEAALPQPVGKKIVKKIKHVVRAVTPKSEIHININRYNPSNFREELNQIHKQLLKNEIDSTEINKLITSLNQLKEKILIQKNDFYKLTSEGKVSPRFNLRIKTFEDQYTNLFAEIEKLFIFISLIQKPINHQFLDVENKIKFDKALTELIETEQNYNKTLSLLLKFKEQFLSDENLNDMVIEDRDFFKSYFSLLRSKYDLSLVLISKLKNFNEQNPEEIAINFINDSFYYAYNNIFDFNQVASILRRNPTLKKNFSDFMTRWKENNEISKEEFRLPLQDCLLVPIQRINKYPLLLSTAAEFAKNDNDKSPLASVFELAAIYIKGVGQQVELESLL